MQLHHRIRRCIPAPQTPTDCLFVLTVPSSMQTLLLVVFSALAVAQAPLRAPVPAPERAPARAPARVPTSAPTRAPARAPEPGPRPSVLTTTNGSATGNDASGFIRVQGTSFVDEQCKDFLPTGWNTYVMVVTSAAWEEAHTVSTFSMYSFFVLHYLFVQVAGSAHPPSHCRHQWRCQGRRPGREHLLAGCQQQLQHHALLPDRAQGNTALPAGSRWELLSKVASFTHTVYAWHVVAALQGGCNLAHATL